MVNVILVDQNDNAIAIGEKLKVHNLGLLHRAFSVFVFDRNLLLLQQRAQSLYHSGGLWSNTCCSHPLPFEKTIDAGARRLKEEMGFSLELQNVGKILYKHYCSNDMIEHEIDHVLVGDYNYQQIIVNEKEVMNYKWQTVDLIKQDLDEYPQRYTKWFSQALDLVLKFKNMNKLNKIVLKV